MPTIVTAVFDGGDAARNAAATLANCPVGEGGVSVSVAYEPAADFPGAQNAAGLPGQPASDCYRVRVRCPDAMERFVVAELAALGASKVEVRG